MADKSAISLTLPLMFELSIYTHLFARNGHWYIFNSQSSFFAEISKEFYAVLYNRDFDSIPDSIISQLAERHVICKRENQYSYYYDEYIRFFSSCYNRKHANIVIVPTTDCNFNCPYCFEGKKANKYMSEDIQKDIIQYLKEPDCPSDISLTWYGGEPLMGISIIESLFPKILDIEKIKVKSHSIVSNGYLITNRVIDFINKYNVNSIQITLDGNEDRHNHLRALKISGGKTYDRIINNIDKLYHSCHDLNINIRVNINRENRMDFLSIFEYFQKKYSSKRIYVYPGFIREDTPDNCSLCYNSMDSEQRMDLYKNLSDNGLRLKYIPKATKSRGCMMQSSVSMIIGPQGEIYKCWNDVNNPEKIIGYIGKSGIKNHQIIEQQMALSHPFSDSSCKNCMIFPICSGGCGWYRLRNVSENGKFSLCPIYKDTSRLEDILLMSLENHHHIFNQQLPIL